MRLPIPERLAYPVYSALMDLGLPLALIPAAPLLALKRKRRRTILPRLGFQSYPTLAADAPAPVWIHALSVGEFLSVVPLIRRLKPALGARPLVVSVSTLAAHTIAESQLRGIADGLFYFPLDTALAYRRCLARIRPALFVLVETDIWPGYLRFFRQQHVPAILINGRLSPDSFRAWQRWGCLFGPALRAFERIHGQSAAENDRFIALGIERERLGRPGNLKFDACGPRPSLEEIQRLRADLGYGPADPILVAGSTHRGEEEIVRRVFLRLRNNFPDVKLISVPRHPDRAEEVRGLFTADSLRSGLLTDRLAPAPDVLVVNQFGHLNRLYHLATIAFIGGSLVPKGGQNPIEPAMAGKPVLFGPDMTDFPDVAPALTAGGGAFAVQGESDLLERCHELFADPRRAREVGDRARSVVEPHGGVTETLVTEILARLSA